MSGDGAIADGVRVGAHASRRVTFDAESIRRFASLCGDHNPLHHDERTAAQGPFGTLIASGPHVVALMMGLDATFLSKERLALGLGFEFRFVKAVPAGATLSLEWTVSAVERKVSLAGEIVSVEGRAVDDAGTVYVTATGRNLLRPSASTPDHRTQVLDLPTMPVPLEFHFDFSSPYGYLGAEKIEALAARHGRGVDWRPMLLGVAFKATGSQPLTSIPIKGDYTKRDLPRSARFHGIALNMPRKFPIATQAPARIVLWQRARDPGSVGTLVKALYRAYFVDGRDIGDPDVAAEIAATVGVERDAARAVVDDPVWKDALRGEVEAAMAKGVFGSPFVFVDGEPFWGIDRFDQIDRWLAERGF